MLSRFNNPSETLKANEAKSNWGSADENRDSFSLGVMLIFEDVLEQLVIKGVRDRCA